MADGGNKLDTGKDPWHLAPWDAFRAVVMVLAFGANKYGERNWEKGIVYSRLYSAAQRHLTAWWNGEDKDPETGSSHLAHAGCCVMFMLAFVLRGSNGLDDRPRTPTKPAISLRQKLANLIGVEAELSAEEAWSAFVCWQSGRGTHETWNLVEDILGLDHDVSGETTSDEFRRAWG